MNWSKAVIAGVAGGIANAVFGFITHGLLLGKTYESMPTIFRQDANPMWFPVINIVIGIAGAMLFARTRNSWADGTKGGATFGFFVGLIAFTSMFYTPLVHAGFPYYLTWCWGTIGLLGWMIWGAVAGNLYKRSM